MFDLLVRAGSSYRSAPHLLAYNPAEKAILLCSVMTAIHSPDITHADSTHSLPLSHTPFLPLSLPPPHPLPLTPSPSLQNTTSSDNAYYELFSLPKNADPSNPECRLLLHIHNSILFMQCTIIITRVHIHVYTCLCVYMYMYICVHYEHVHVHVLIPFTVADVEGKRSPGLTAVWLARNRFAVLDKTHQVRSIQWSLYMYVCIYSVRVYTCVYPIYVHCAEYTDDMQYVCVIIPRLSNLTNHIGNRS